MCQGAKAPPQGREGAAHAKIDQDGSRLFEDTRYLLPLPARQEMPVEDNSLPLLEFSIVGKDALCINIRTRSAWTGGQWLKFAHQYYGPFASIVGCKPLEDKEK